MSLPHTQSELDAAADAVQALWSVVDLYEECTSEDCDGLPVDVRKVTRPSELCAKCGLLFHVLMAEVAISDAMRGTA